MFYDKLKEGGLIESIYSGGGYGLITSKKQIWLDEDEMLIHTGQEVEDIGNYAFDYKDGHYAVYQFDILINNQLQSYLHFQLGLDWNV